MALLVPKLPGQNRGETHLVQTIYSGFFSPLKTKALPGEKKRPWLCSQKSWDNQGHSCTLQVELLSLNFRCNSFISEYWGKEFRCFRDKKALGTWEAPVVQRAEAERGKSHPLGMNPVSSPKVCWGSTEGLVASCLPDKRLEAHENGSKQPSCCYLLQVSPRARVRCCTQPPALLLQPPTDTHPDVSGYRCALCRGGNTHPWLSNQFFLWFASFWGICHNTSKRTMYVTWVKSCINLKCFFSSLHCP